MQRETRRRAFLGGLAVAGAGAGGYLLRPDRSGGTTVRYLGPAENLDGSETFASVRGLVDSNAGTMDVWVATREKAYERQSIRLFPGTDRTVEATMSALRGDWRFDADVSGMDPGEYTLEVGELSLPVVLEESVPDRFRNPRLGLRPRGLWRTAFADAYGYDAGPASGRLVVDFRERTPPLATDSVVFRAPDETVVGRRDIPDGVYRTTVALEPFEAADGRGTLRRLRDGHVIDELELQYQ